MTIPCEFPAVDKENRVDIEVVNPVRPAGPETLPQDSATTSSLPEGTDPSGIDPTSTDSAGVDSVRKPDAWESWTPPGIHDSQESDITEDSTTLGTESDPIDSQTDQAAVATPKTIGVSAALASGMALMIGRRRLNQLRSRPVGRRILHPDTQGRRFAAALDTVGAQAIVPTSTVRLSGLIDGIDSLQTPGWLQDLDLNNDPLQSQLSIESLWMTEHGMTISVGEDLGGNPVMAEIGGSVPFLVTSDRGEGLTRVMRGIAMNMAVEECLSGTELHIITNDDLFDSFENLHRHLDADDAIETMREITSNRLGFIGDNDWNNLRDDPNCGEAWRSVVFIFTHPINTTQYSQLSGSLMGPNLGVAAVVPMILENPATTHLPSRGLRVESENHAILSPQEVSVRPHQLQPSQPMLDLLETSASEETTSAWWLSESSNNTSSLHVTERYPDMHTSMMNHSGFTASTTFSHPTLRILGPIQLEGARGAPIARAERSCMEYCCWLLEHPGTTAMAMAQGLMVAESTRRSNMSRLRGWLGLDECGNPYLPEAYSGRIWLDPAVTSDWHRMCLLLNRGIEEADTENLIEALTLVRGAPLADATPGQWHWAEEMRTDMVSLIRDIGVVATNRCVANHDIDRARWAASRALIAAPEDEMLLCARVRTEHSAGNRMEVERLASWISRNARNLGVDLFPDTVKTLHHVLGAVTSQ